MQTQVDTLNALLAQLQASSKVVTRDSAVLKKRLLSQILDLLNQLQTASGTILDTLEALLPEIRALNSASTPSAVTLLEQIIASVAPLVALLS